MASLVYVEFGQGIMARYEIGGSAVRQTHRYIHGSPMYPTPRLIEEFRTMPDPDFAIEPPPRPTDPPATAGLARAA